MHLLEVSSYPHVGFSTIARAEPAAHRIEIDANLELQSIARSNVELFLSPGSLLWRAMLAAANATVDWLNHENLGHPQRWRRRLDTDEKKRITCKNRLTPINDSGSQIVGVNHDPEYRRLVRLPGVRHLGRQPRG
jgi:hypothetical protein